MTPVFCFGWYPDSHSKTLPHLHSRAHFFEVLSYRSGDKHTPSQDKPADVLGLRDRVPLAQTVRMQGLPALICTETFTCVSVWHDTTWALQIPYSEIRLPAAESDLAHATLRQTAEAA